MDRPATEPQSIASAAKPKTQQNSPLSGMRLADARRFKALPLSVFANHGTRTFPRAPPNWFPYSTLEAQIHSASAAHPQTAPRPGCDGQSTGSRQSVQDKIQSVKFC